MAARRHRLLDASAVPPEAIVAVTGPDGDDLVVWRSASGVPCVMEARCPHNWSHLAAEGVVAGEEIVCLTHLWRFQPDGSGWKEAMNGRRDRKGDIAVFACDEADGAIWLRSGAAITEPDEPGGVGDGDEADAADD